MIQYVFAIDDKSEVKYSPAKYSKYQAYKDCKKHYPNATLTQFLNGEDSDE
jgi:hypothetical protein